MTSDMNGKECGVMSLVAVEIKVPEDMRPYVIKEDSNDVLIRNALLLYPYIMNKTISHGKAAEILGIGKLEIIDLYSSIGFSYFDQTMDELEEDIDTFKALGLDKVVTA